MARRKRNDRLKTPADFGLDEVRYAAWITYLFDRPVTPNGWYFDEFFTDEGFEADARETVALIGCTMARSGTDLARFSDEQTYCGLNYMVSEVFCQAYCFGDADVPIEARVAAIEGFHHLYRDCLARRCTPILGHLSETGSKLTGLAYMLWDISPIFVLNYDVPAVVAAIVEVLETALASSNDACIEGALHGLGHTVHFLPDVVRPVIARFIASTYDAGTKPRAGDAWRPVRRELRIYAERAETGCIL